MTLLTNTGITTLLAVSVERMQEAAETLEDEIIVLRFGTGSLMIVHSAGQADLVTVAIRAA
jgi:hypothetical protein